jgi:hypothetical protein
MGQFTHAPRTPPTLTPPDITARMRRYTLLIIGGTLLLATGFIGVQIYLLKSIPKAREDKPEPPAWTTSASPVAAGRPLVLPELKPKDGKPESPEVVLDVVGSLMSAHLYQTFVSIGLLADAVEEGVYPIPKGKALLATLDSFIEHAEQQLVQLPPSAFPTEEDRRAMETARSLLTKLRKQTKEVAAYWDAKDDKERSEHLANFREARTDAGGMIQKLVNVQD